MKELVKRGTVGLIALAAAMLCGCSSFERDWSRAAKLPALESDPLGAWAGTWQNTNNTHGGELRALLVRNSATNYTATFHATWGRHSGTFRTRLKGGRTGNTLEFTGSKRLLFVRIRNVGSANPTNFVSTYESRFDNGTFTLTRPRQGRSRADGEAAHGGQILPVATAGGSKADL